MSCRSEPPLGSVSAMAARTSPVAIRGSQRSCCSGVPKRAMQPGDDAVPAHRPGQAHPAARELGGDQRRSSGSETADSLQRSGTASPKTPISFIWSISAAGYSCSRSSRPACGRTSRSTQCATASTIACSSSGGPARPSAQLSTGRAPSWARSSDSAACSGSTAGSRSPSGGPSAAALGHELARLGRLGGAGRLPRLLGGDRGPGGGRRRPRRRRRPASARRAAR